MIRAFVILLALQIGALWGAAETPTDSIEHSIEKTLNERHAKRNRHYHNHENRPHLLHTWKETFKGTSGSIDLATNALPYHELQSLITILKAISMMVESHYPFAHLYNATRDVWKPEDFLPGDSAFTNQGHIYDVEEQVIYYSAVVRARPEVTHTVCETGFNAGHSAVTWLFSNPNITLHSFDLGNNPWTEMCVGFVKYIYGDRFHYHRGNSREMLFSNKPPFSEGVRCDLLSIDGDHSNPKADIVLGHEVSRKGALVLVDDLGNENRNIIKDWNDCIFGKKIVAEIEAHKNFKWIEKGEYHKGWALGEII